MGKSKKKLFEFFSWKFFNYYKISKNTKFSNTNTSKNFEFWIFEVLYLRFSNFIIFGLLNFKNVEIHILELTYQSISGQSNQF